MRKRIFSALLALCLSVTTLAGCGAKTYEATLPTEEEQADIYVEKIDGLSDDFIKGMDISTLLAEDASGVKYYDEDGAEQDLLKILADNGINYIRVRVWNDPYDEDGNGYGGGNCDVDTAAEIGKRAAAYGMKLCVDFHYSDFWADPNKQYAPKAWADYSMEEKEEALYDFTKESLNTIIKAGADVGMVQIGNEINNGMAGEKVFSNIVELLKQGSAAVRAVDKDIKVVVHYTSVDDSENTLEIAKGLDDAELDYDVFGISFYTYWHGSYENMENVLSAIADTYGVSTCIMETSYLYTTEDGDDSANSVSEPIDNYPATPQGQANNVRDVMSAAAEAGALGVFYWEGAWIPVGDSYDSNTEIWESNGSGWASSYAGSYDPYDAGLNYGGCAWDNQAFFDFDGNVLPSLGVFKYVNYGAVGTGLEVLGVNDVDIEIGVGEPLELPESVEAIYNDSSCTDPVAVTWEDNDIDTSVAGTYTVEGSTENGTKVTANIKVSNINYLENPSFEDGDTSMWVVESEGANPTDIQNKAADAYSGDKAFHFYSESAIDFKVEQTLSDLPAGTYNAVANLQGGDVGSDADIYLYVSVNGEIYESEKVTLDGWQQWKTPVINDIPVNEGDEIKVGVAIKCAAKGWGTLDDLEFYNQR